MSQPLRWWKIRLELYRRIRRQVEARLGGYDSEIIKYQAAYEVSLRRPWRKSNRDKLFRALMASDIVLIGDFHSLAQSQRSALRILRELNGKRELQLGMECFRPEQNKLIESYLKGRILERTFVDKSLFKKRWGFPWSHYHQLMTWAKDKKVSVFGVDAMIGAQPKKSVSLKKRDGLIAREIIRRKKEHPESLIVVLIGDWHLADDHLLKALHAQTSAQKKTYRICRLFQNDEKIYFDLLRKNRDHEVDLVQFSKDDFGLITVPPWVKWQSYQLFLDGTLDLIMKQDRNRMHKVHFERARKESSNKVSSRSSPAAAAADEVQFLAADHDDSEMDPSDWVLQALHLLEAELNIRVDKSALAIYSPQDAHFWEKIIGNYSRPESRWAEKIIASDFSFYFDKARVGLLIRPTANHVSSLAMHYLHLMSQESAEIEITMPLFFESWIWLEIFRYFGSKLINPKRKTDSVEDLRLKLDSGEHSGATKESMLVALSQRVVELKRINSGKKASLRFKPKSKYSLFHGAWILGRIHGERLYQAYRQGLVPAEKITAYMKVGLQTPEWQLAYMDFVRELETWPVSARRTHRL